MRFESITFAGAAGLVVVFAAALLYRFAWLRLRRDDATPTGFGVLLGPVLLAGSLAQTSSTMHVAFVVVALATAAYWLDDLIELRARVRLLISFAAGMGIAASWLVGSFDWPLVFGLMLLAGVICIVLTNIVNFYDGADLNLATFIAATAGLVLIYDEPGSQWVPVGIACLVLILPFAVLNTRPRTLYLGDSGSFAFAGLLTTMAVAFLADIGSVPPEAAIAAALPTFDVAYVFAVRVAEKHDLLTRNYLHLYQKLGSRYGGFAYLLPQLINIALCLALAAALRMAGAGRIASVIAAIILVTIPFYLACRRLLVGDGPAVEAARRP